MTAAAEAIVRSVYERFAKGDLDGFLKLCSPEIEWVVNGPATLRKCRRFTGIAGVCEFLDILGATWTFSSFQPRQFLVSGSSVVVLGEEAGTDNGTAVPFRNRWAHVFDLADGRVVRFREFLCHWTGDEQPPEMSW